MNDNNILYVVENFTSFSLACNGEVLNEDYLDINMDNGFKLRCAKCNKYLTLEEHEAGKLQGTDNKRKVNGEMYDKLLPQDMLIYSMEHKRCSHK